MPIANIDLTKAEAAIEVAHKKISAIQALPGHDENTVAALGELARATSAVVKALREWEPLIGNKP